MMRGDLAGLVMTKNMEFQDWKVKLEVEYGISSCASKVSAAKAALSDRYLNTLQLVAQLQAAV